MVATTGSAARGLYRHTGIGDTCATGAELVSSITCQTGQFGEGARGQGHHGRLSPSLAVQEQWLEKGCKH